MSLTCRWTSGERAAQAYWNFLIEDVILGMTVLNWNSALANHSSASSGLNGRSLGSTAATRIASSSVMEADVSSGGCHQSVEVEIPFLFRTHQQGNWKPRLELQKPSIKLFPFPQK